MPPAPAIPCAQNAHATQKPRTAVDPSRYSESGVKPSGPFNNCAIWNVAERYVQACSTELDFLRDVFTDAKVKRLMHRRDGNFTCGYEIRPIVVCSTIRKPVESPSADGRMRDRPVLRLLRSPRLPLD